MTTLADLRDRLEIKLDDAGNVYWSEAELGAHIESALRDLSHHIPRQMKNTIATVASNRDLDISALTDRVRIRAVEYKTGNWPRTFAPFSLWMDTLTFTGDDVPDGANCYVYWEAMHIINGTQSLPTDHEEALLFGAAWMACDQQIADSTGVLATGGPGTPRDWKALAAHFHAQYLARLMARRGLRRHRLFVPDEPTPTQDTDPGP